MRKVKARLFFIVSLLVVAVTVAAQSQDKIMQVHSGGNVVYAINTLQVDSVTFQDGTLPESLINTKWKLSGIVDAETGAVTELEPKECRECYTLSFGTDYTAIANSIYLPLQLELRNLGVHKILEEILIFKEWYDNISYEETLDFRKAIAEAEACVVTEDELKLYYNDKKNYLRFIPYINSVDDNLNDLITSNLSRKGVADPVLLIGEWDFAKYAYTEDGNVVSEVSTISGGYLKIVATKLINITDQWLFENANENFYDFSLSGNLVKLRFRRGTYAMPPPEEVDIMTALKSAYSFVIIGDELLIYYTGKEDKNLLVLKKR